MIAEQTIELSLERIDAYEFRVRFDAATPYASIRRIFALPKVTSIFLCHDDKALGRVEFVHETTVAAEVRRSVAAGQR